MKKKVSAYVFIVFFIVLIFVLINKEDKNNQNNKIRVEAEISGSSPESGATSRLKSAYDSLVTKGANYGDSSASDWIYGSNGTYWNRIIYAAAWEPGGDATPADVLAGKTFYSGNNNRTIRTGTAPSLDYSLQQYAQIDDSSPSDYVGEESSWSSPATNVWKDTRTGLYWSRSEPATLTNLFTAISSATCDFFTTTPRKDYGNSSTDPDCGNAINICAVLNLTSGGTSNTDWYLPSKKELIGAYIDGMYNQAGPTFTTPNLYWSSTERSTNSATAYGVYIGNGYTLGTNKTSAYAVRCVRRD